jgi:MoaA/NifB/PqqE/SkfB family radical SAM enzyme
VEILIEDKQQYRQEQDNLLKTMLDLRFFNPWRDLTKMKDDFSLRADANLELYITSTCNQKCEYCYLVKYPKLYPKEYNKPEIILKNMRILFNYIVANRFNIPTLDLYSGEIWGMPFGWKILDTIYEYVSGGMMIGSIMLTTNCSFIDNPEAFQRIQQYIDKFNMINCPIIISISVDGKVVDDFSRPRNNKDHTYTDEFYDKLYAFAKHNNFLFHPMVAPQNVALWIENYKWWQAQNKKYGLDDSNLMTLEVRNDGWTDENIEDYCKFLRFLMDEFFEKSCHKSPRLFGNAVVGARITDGDPQIGGYIPWAIGVCDTFAGCTIPNHLTVRLGDLAICPCHRQAYDEYLYGYFITNNDRIVDIKAVNPLMAVKILMGNILTSSPLCDTCEFNYCCLKGCFGSQLETEKDPFFPIENVCKFFKAKYTCIFDWYREHDIIKYFQTWIPNEPQSVMVGEILRINDILEAKKNGMGTTV